MNIIEILNNDEEIKNIHLKLNYAKLKKNNFLEVVFNVFNTLDSVIQNKIYDIINNELSNKYELEVRYEIVESDENEIIDFIKSYLISNLIYVLSIKIENNNCIISSPSGCENNIKNNNIVSKLNERIFTEYNKNYCIEFLYEEENDFEYSRELQNQIIQNNIDIINKPKTLLISDIDNIYGKIEVSETCCIKGLKFKDSTIYLCGKIAFLAEQKTRDKEEDGNLIEGKKYLSFSLNDDTGFIKCSIFSNTKNEIIFNTLENGMTVVCAGKLREYHNNLSFNISYIAKCDYEFKETPKVSFPEPKYYYTVIPEKYYETSQLSLFEIKTEEPVNEFLKNKSFVVFDFETTGFDAETDAVTELGAVKVVNGKIVETFSTFVNPLRHIPDNITQLTHITDEMVKDAPKIKDVVVDFYKFCYGSAIVAHNIEFDYKFLSYNANKIGVKFDNKQYDTLILGRKYVKGLKNYKLGTLCEYMNVELVDAHRAVNDCLATAKLFIKLTDYIKE